MIYRPKTPRTLWDSWLFEWQDTFHLFYLESIKTQWDHVGHAVSSDLVHWQSRPSIPTKGKTGTWNESSTLTGMVVPHHGRFYMFVGASYNSVQLVGVHSSNDLDTWTPYPENPVMCPQGSYYLAKPEPPQCPQVDWRDPCIIYRKEDKHYHALVCARRPERSHRDSGAVVGHLRSRDLIHWKYLPPLDAPTGRFSGTEVPDIFQLGGKYYLLVSSSTLYGVRHNTTSRDDASGTYYMISDAFEGPYTLPDDYLLIGSAQGNVASYVGRTIPYQGGRLLYHHIQANSTQLLGTWCSPKMVRTHNDDSLYLQYLPALEKLETGVILHPTEKRDCFEVQDLGDWQQHNGVIRGKSSVLGSACKIAEDVADLHLTCKINSASSTSRPGIILRSVQGKGVLISLNFEKQRLEIGIVSYQALTGWGTGLQQLLAGRGTDIYQDICRCEFKQGRDYHLRCFARDEHFEVYLDDRWIFTSVLADVSKAGDVELNVSHGQAIFSELRLATIEPLL